MRIRGHERRSQLSLCLAAANKFLLTEERAVPIMEKQVAVIVSYWEVVCDEAE